MSHEITETSGSIRAQPATSGTIGAQPATSGPIRAQPAKSGPIRAQSVISGPIGAQPATSGPIGAQPATIGSIGAQPATSGPIRVHSDTTENGKVNGTNFSHLLSDWSNAELDKAVDLDSLQQASENCIPANKRENHSVGRGRASILTVHIPGTPNSLDTNGTGDINSSSHLAPYSKAKVITYPRVGVSRGKLLNNLVQEIFRPGVLFN